MKASSFPVRSIFVLVLLALPPLAFGPSASSAEPPEGAAPAPPVVKVRTTDYAFWAPAELRSGWNTLRMTNEGEEAHFLVLWLLPEGKTFDAYVQEVYEPFMGAFLPYKAGEVSREEMLERLGGALPEWLDLPAMGRGGVGLTSPGRTGVSTVNLEPGMYVMECYMVTDQGEVHNQLGMLRPLEVKEEETGAAPPEADVELTLANDGIRIDGELGPGERTVRVTVAERPAGLLGHDVHLARLGEDTAIDEVVAWMDWIDGLTPPAPAEFLGGAEQVPPGHTSYVTVELEPGRYAWISEGYGRDGLVEELRIE